ncbi:MAG TPA: efflux RND transporter periplasmic adaptor subunit [Candidatus Kapabacteria bacterium]|nr:efflux RND transporter periplasmic adaptor subunit [Candidatus Kapabacteria bacterium]
MAILIWSHGQGSQPTWLPVSASKFESDTTAMVRLTNEAMVRAGIVAQPVEMRNFSSIISAVGIMEIPDPAERTIAARARGRIEKMFVSATGMYVHKGESLFEFYSPDILSAETEYLIAAGVGDMDKNIMAQNPGMEHHSDPGLLKAAKERLLLYGLTSEQINRLEDNLKVSNTVTITAPIDGIILQKQSQEGAYVDEGASIYQLADLSMLWAEVEVPEADIRFIRMGQTIPIQAEAYPGAEFKGTVILISPIEDQASRTIRVRLAVPNPSGKLRPAMTFTTSVPIAAGNALAIPQSAVIRSGIADYVWVASDNNMFTRHSVTLGALSSDNYYQVLSGLSFGDRVAANGAFLIDAEHDLSQNNPMAGMNMGEAGNKNSGEGTGVVRSIDNERQKITLDHSTIPGVMPAMTMAYKVADPKFLHSVSTNESVRFTLTREVNGEYLITSIQKQ